MRTKLLEKVLSKGYLLLASLLLLSLLALPARAAFTVPSGVTTWFNISINNKDTSNAIYTDNALNITVNALAFAAYANGYFNNFEIFNGMNGGYIPYQWLEGNAPKIAGSTGNEFQWTTLNTVNSITIWINTGGAAGGNFINPNTNAVNVLSIGFLSMSTNAMNGNNVGEAPQLNCPTGSTSTVTSCKYGEYDNGANVFATLYQSFENTATPTGWSLQGTSIAIDNGVTLTGSASGGAAMNDLLTKTKYGNTIAYQLQFFAKTSPAAPNTNNGYLAIGYVNNGMTLNCGNTDSACNVIGWLEDGSPEQGISPFILTTAGGAGVENQTLDALSTYYLFGTYWKISTSSGNKWFTNYYYANTVAQAAPTIPANVGIGAQASGTWQSFGPLLWFRIVPNYVKIPVEQYGSAQSSSGYTAPTVAQPTVTNTIVDVGQYQTITEVTSSGTTPYTVNVNVVNSITTGTLVEFNSIASTTSTTTNFVYLVAANDLSNSMEEANIIVVDAHPSTVNSVYSAKWTVYNTLSALAPTTSNNIYTSNPATITANPVNGAPGYVYAWYSIAGSAAPTCTAANIITGQTGKTLNIGSYLVAGGITSFAYQVTDSATTNAVVCSPGLTIIDPTISSLPFLSATMAENQNNFSVFTTWVAIPGTVGAGSHTYDANYQFYNSITNVLLFNSLVTGIANTLTSNVYAWTINSFYFGNSISVNVIIGNSVTPTQAYSPNIQTLTIASTTNTFTCTGLINSNTFINGLEYQFTDNANVMDIYTAPKNAFTVNTVYALLAPTAPSTQVDILLNDTQGSTTLSVPNEWYFQYDFWPSNTPNFREVCQPLPGNPTFNSVTTNAVIANAVNTMIVNAITLNGNVVGNNALFNGNIVGANLFGNVIGSNNIYGATIAASTAFLGAIMGSNTASFSTAWATTFLGTISGANSITGLTLNGNVVGNNAVFTQNVMANNGIFNNINDNDITIVNCIGCSTYNSQYIDSISGVNGILATLSGQSETIGINTVSPLKNTSSSVSCPTCSGSTYNSAYLTNIYTSNGIYNTISGQTETIGAIAGTGITNTLDQVGATGYNSAYWTGTNYNSQYIDSISGVNGILATLSGQSETIGINTVSPLKNTSSSVSCPTCSGGGGGGTTYTFVAPLIVSPTNVVSLLTNVPFTTNSNGYLSMNIGAGLAINSSGYLVNLNKTGSSGGGGGSGNYVIASCTTNSPIPIDATIYQNTNTPLIIFADSETNVTGYYGNTPSVSEVVKSTNTSSSTLTNQTDGVVLNPENTIAYVSDINAGVIYVIDVASNTVTGTINVGKHNEPARMAITPDGSLLYVADYNNNTVSVIDTSTNKVINIIPVGAQPVAVAITSDGTIAYVANQDDRTISVIDVASNTVINTIPVGVPAGGPVDVKFLPSGLVAYVAVYSNYTISVIDVASNTVVNTIILQGEPTAVAISSNGSTAYASQVGYGLSIINTSTNTVTGSIYYSIFNPELSDVAMGPANQVFVTDLVYSQLIIINSTAESVAYSVPLGYTPQDVAVLPNSGVAYVTSGQPAQQNVSSAVGGMDIKNITAYVIALNQTTTMIVPPDYYYEYNYTGTPIFNCARLAAGSASGGGGGSSDVIVLPSTAATSDDTLAYAAIGLSLCFGIIGLGMFINNRKTSEKKPKKQTDK